MILYVDNSIKFEVVEIDVRERNWWTITININDIRYKGIIMLIYHSPTSSDVQFLNCMKEKCNDDMLKGNVIIMGDFNIDMSKESFYQKKLINLMNSIGLKQLVKEPTRIVGMAKTIIYLVFSNTEISIEIKHEPSITDHSLLLLHWKVRGSKEVSRIVIKRNYRKMDSDEFLKLISARMQVIQIASAEEVANAVVTEIAYCLDVVAPKVAHKIKSKWQRKGWFSNEIKQTIKQRDRAHKIARNSNEECGWMLFRNLRNKVVSLSRKVRKEWIAKKLDDNKRNPKQMWRTLKEMIKGNSESNNVHKEIMFKGYGYRDRKVIVEKVNRYFL